MFKEPVCCVALLKCRSAVTSVPSGEEDSDWLCWSPDVDLAASRCAHLWFRMQYLDIDWRRCCEIGNRYFCPPQEESESPLWLSDSLDRISIRALLPCEKLPISLSMRCLPLAQNPMRHGVARIAVGPLVCLRLALKCFFFCFVIFWGGGDQ